MESIKHLYHTSYLEIRKPDIHFGRKNADFGQGFYLSAEREFAGRWVRDRKGERIVVNIYALDFRDLRVRRFIRDNEWFDYIFQNRRGVDALPEVDVVIGPIANDTLYNTYGIFTSGLLDPDLALRLLQIGPAYEQIAIKTEKAAAQLVWQSAQILEAEETDVFRRKLEVEERAYQEALAGAMNALEKCTRRDDMPEQRPEGLK